MQAAMETSALRQSRPGGREEGVGLPGGRGGAEVLAGYLPWGTEVALTHQVGERVELSAGYLPALHRQGREGGEQP